MKFITNALFSSVVAVVTTLPLFVYSTKESNPSIGIVGRDKKNFSLLWKPSQEDHELFTDLDIIKSCANENYEVKLAVHAQPHAFLLSIPTDDKKKCPHFMWHADFVDPKRKDALEKSVYAYVDDSTVFERDMKLLETIFVGNYFLKDIAEAFDQADDGNDKPYDSVTNNCGLLLINMGKYLQFDYYSNPELVAYVQRHMLDEDGPNMAYLKSPHARGLKDDEKFEWDKFEQEFERGENRCTGRCDSFQQF